MKIKLATSLGSLGIAIFLLVGCGNLGGFVGGPMTSFVATYKIRTMAPLDVFGAADSLVQATGFVVQESDQDDGRLTLVEGMSEAAVALVGTSKSGSILITGIGTRHLKIRVELMGNFGYPSQNNADELAAQIANVLNVPSPVARKPGSNS